MRDLKELEQLKKEYKEIPIPKDGIKGVEEAIARAGKKKRQKSYIMRYTAMAAAAALLILVIPKSMDMSMMKFANEGDIASEGMAEKITIMSGDGAIKEGEAADLYCDKYAAGEAAPESVLSGAEAGLPPTNTVAAENSDDADRIKDLKEGFTAEECKKISEEIMRQMKEQMQSGEKTYYIQGKEYPEGFACITKEQKCYINEEGLLVILFEAGEAAPSAYGAIEFVIPDEAWK